MTDEAEASGAGGVAERVAPLAERAAARSGCELVRITYGSEAGSWVLRVTIDRAEGIDVENCAAVSRQLSAMLDVDDLVPGAYNLEVTSPGVDRELLVAADYERFAGRQIRLRPAQRLRGRKLVRGTLRGIQGDTVRVEDAAGDVIELPLSQVAEARLEYKV